MISESPYIIFIKCETEVIYPGKQCKYIFRTLCNKIYTHIKYNDIRIRGDRFLFDGHWTFVNQIGVYATINSSDMIQILKRSRIQYMSTLFNIWCIRIYLYANGYSNDILTHISSLMYYNK